MDILWPWVLRDDVRVLISAFEKRMAARFPDKSLHYIDVLDREIWSLRNLVFADYFNPYLTDTVLNCSLRELVSTRRACARVARLWRGLLATQSQEALAAAAARVRAESGAASVTVIARPK